MDISNHAIKRLHQRFKLDKSHIRNILSILNNPKACKKLSGHKQKHLKFKYRGEYIIAVIRDNTILTFKYSDGKYRKLQSEKDKRRNEEMKELFDINPNLGQQPEVAIDREKELIIPTSQLVGTQENPHIEKTMTVKEIADSLQTPIRTVHNAIDRCFPNLKKNGKTTYLTNKQVTTISKELKKAHNVDLASTRKVAITDMELLDRSRDLIFDLTSRVKQLNEENQKLKPKAEFTDIAIRDNTTHYSIRDAGKHLGLSQSKMFTLVRQHKLLTNKNLPTQKALDYNLMTLRTNVCLDGKNRQQAVMTMENIYNFEQRYIKVGIDEIKNS